MRNKIKKKSEREKATAERYLGGKGRGTKGAEQRNTRDTENHTNNGESRFPCSTVIRVTNFLLIPVRLSLFDCLNKAHN